MGQDIHKSRYSEADFAEFKRRLRKETAVLHRWLEERRFEAIFNPTLGVELETWLVDQEYQPLPRNREFLRHLNLPTVVPELSKYNAEINLTPQAAGRGCLERMHREIVNTWHQITGSMKHLGGKMIMIGTLPTLRDEMLTVDFLSDFDRYRALNEQVLNLRSAAPIRLHIEGQETIDSVHRDIMLEAATTSFQVHFKPPIDQFIEYYNCSHLISAATVAAAANAPYLFGCSLWDESRIPLFEQAVELIGYRNADGSVERRVTFGHDYTRQSVMEVFLDNLDGHPILLPDHVDADPEKLAHLRLHNGTIWRWNRPVIGNTSESMPHIRLEHRVMSAGPSAVDCTANLAFAAGLLHDLSIAPEPATEFASFHEAKANFYAAARFGLQAKVIWRRQHEVPLRKLIADDFIPRARRGLQSLGIGADEIGYYLDEVFAERIRSGQNGATWQRRWVAKNGKDFRGMLADYSSYQDADDPVYSWRL